jgi:hypothetical protein
MLFLLPFTQDTAAVELRIDQVRSAREGSSLFDSGEQNAGS